MAASLRIWQGPACARLVDIHNVSRVSGNLSDPGTGKSYMCAALMKSLNVRPLVLTPKSVVTSFKNVFTDFGVEPLDVLNIEKLKTGKTPWVKPDTAMPSGLRWTLPRDSWIVVDEAHRCGGRESQNGTLLALTKAFGYNVHMMSATLADSPLRLRAVGFLAGLYQSFQGFDVWCGNNGCKWEQTREGRWIFRFVGGQQYLTAIHEKLAPLVVRLRIADIPGFPECDTQAMVYDLDDKYTDELNKIYAEMDAEIAKPKLSAPETTIRLRARQRTELIKVPLLRDLANEAIESGQSPVLFVNFRETAEALVSELTRHGCSLVIGEQSEQLRDDQIRRFQENENLVCVATAAGGEGVNLHDLHGRPRIAYITPCESSTLLKQMLGRIHRDGSVSKAVQRFVTVAGTIEEKVYRNLRRKLNNLDLINDGDLGL